jgi:DNA-directed RNA polymerase specialized sigma24 family protein
MAVSTTFNDEDVRILLIGSEGELAQGLAEIDRHLRAGLCGMVRREFPGISPEDLADVWGCVLMNLLQLVRENRFDADEPLRPLLCRLARARATDLVRRRQAHDNLVAGVGEALRDTQTGVEWGRMSVAERREAMALIRAAIGTLPMRQRIVMQVFVDHYPETADMQELRRLVSEETGSPETLAAVKRALQEARAKVRDYLQSKGYGIGKVGVP